jgi:ribonuclease R
VVVDHPFVEGLVRVDALSDDYYQFDEAGSRLVGRRSGRSFALGDAVRVEVQSVSVVRRKIDFALAGHMARRKQGADRARPDRGHDRRRGKDKKRAQPERHERKSAKTDRRNRPASRPKKKRR